jgi:hypothetical protein
MAATYDVSARVPVAAGFGGIEDSLDGAEAN